MQSQTTPRRVTTHHHGRGALVAIATALLVALLGACTSSPAPAAEPLPGFSLADRATTGNRGTYTFELVSSASVEALRPAVESVAAELNSIVGRPDAFTVAPGVASTFEPATGVIRIRRVGSLSEELGCLGAQPLRVAVAQACPSLREPGPGGRWYWTSGLTEIRTDTGACDVRGVIAHEIGHTLGLGHYDEPFEGVIQLMNSACSRTTTFQAGDRNGVLSLDANGPAGTSTTAAAA